MTDLVCIGCGPESDDPKTVYTLCDECRAKAAKMKFVVDREN